MKLKNKVAIVTGSSRGIGRATAIELARNGADVAVNALNHPDEGEEVVKEIEQLGRKAFLFQGSVDLLNSLPKTLNSHHLSYMQNIEMYQLVYGS